MVDKAQLYESLSDFIDAVASEDPEAERGAIKGYIGEKSKLTLEALSDNGIKLDGDDVLVAGKKIGVVKSDPEDLESGFKFESDDGKLKQKFDSIDDLYTFVGEHFNVKESSKKLEETEDSVKDEEGAEVEEGKQEDALATQSAKKGERMKRWSAVRNKAQPDGKEGEYDGGDKGDYKDPIKGDNSPANAGGASDIETDGGYDKHDPRSKHKDPIKG